ncbi:MAG TPA: aldo/keto reductase [Atribacteraceae bacterium]|nr:aldo/keto reductase [Atribacteraceae bacterium]
MNKRVFDGCGWAVGEIGFGAWAIGSGWGKVSEDEALAALRAALEAGVNFIDTADVYGDGRSEKLIGQVLREHGGRIYVATKAGRRLHPHHADGYTEANLNQFVDRSLTNLSVDTIDLLQLHCPPPDVYYRPEIFAILDRMVDAGKIQYYGVSVERVEEGLKAIEYPGVRSVQIIFNMFRYRPAELFFHECRKKNVAIIARVPLASGLLSGKMKRDTVFPDDDHRQFNRYGQRFDRGETFSGVDYETGLRAVDKLRVIKPESFSMTQFALKWILMFPEVTTVIPGAKNKRQAEENALTSQLPPLSEEIMDEVEIIYEELIRDEVHHAW